MRRDKKVFCIGEDIGIKGWISEVLLQLPWDCQRNLVMIEY